MIRGVKKMQEIGSLEATITREDTLPVISTSCPVLVTSVT